MATPITLQLSDRLVEQAKRVGNMTQQQVESVLGDALERVSLTWDSLSEEHLPRPIATLSDAEIISLALAKMSAEQHERLGDLQAKGKEAGLTESERYELLALLQIYQLGLLRKSEAIAEAKHRQLPLTLES
ncbi:hypothetical protein ACN4EG_20215 [Alkalinema pantanalense CENA528]|uniref:hypothetical protein n=1 Tax=Alkalinema pantanalense TaxID=1620705 RepID=UPI003D6E91FC